ncbi:hypothetical protein [Streptomyces gardneri]|uniref:hypothetical protein n=1 Tax=Streptomyces gardneri TaxID=66892 RepID=UPI0033E56E4F
MEITAEDAHELARFCAELTEARALARDMGRSAELERLLVELREGARPAAAVTQSVRTLLDLPSRPRGYASFPGQESAPRPAGSYICPGGRCSRNERRTPGAPLHECAVFGEPLMFG